MNIKFITIHYTCTSTKLIPSLPCRAKSDIVILCWDFQWTVHGILLLQSQEDKSFRLSLTSSIRFPNLGVLFYVLVTYHVANIGIQLIYITCSWQVFVFPILQSPPDVAQIFRTCQLHTAWQLLHDNGGSEHPAVSWGWIIWKWQQRHSPYLVWSRLPTDKAPL